MSLAEASRAVEAFLLAVEDAQEFATRGDVGDDLDDVLLHAKEMLDIMDIELSDVSRAEHLELFAAVPVLRQKLERLRDELRGGKAH